jgi:uncharacterized small protein (DUF1192 family)
MTDNTNTEQTNETATTKQGARGPRVVKHRDVKIAELREDIAALQAKLDKLEAEAAAEQQLESLGQGSVVSFVYGRGEKRRVETGTIIASGKNEKGNFQFNVLVGEGLNSTLRLVGAAAIVPPGVTADEFLASLSSEAETAE